MAVFCQYHAISIVRVLYSFLTFTFQPNTLVSCSNHVDRYLACILTLELQTQSEYDHARLLEHGSCV